MNDAHAAQASGRGFDKEFRQGRPRLFRRQSMEIDLVGDAELAPPQASKIALAIAPIPGIDGGSPKPITPRWDSSNMVTSNSGISSAPGIL
mgnify:CR=1 FL=1